MIQVAIGKTLTARFYACFCLHAFLARLDATGHVKNSRHAVLSGVLSLPFSGCRRRPVIVRALRHGALIATRNLARGLSWPERYIMAETIDDNHLAPREGSGY